MKVVNITVSANDGCGEFSMGSTKDGPLEVPMMAQPPIGEVGRIDGSIVSETVGTYDRNELG
jgi:hypothetical protein